MKRITCRSCDAHCGPRNASSDAPKALLSGYGYNLLDAAIQRAANEEYRAGITHLVLRPLGLRGAVAERSDSAIQHLSRGYEPAGTASPRPTLRSDLSDRWPSGGWLATATDIATFAEASVRGPFASAHVPLTVAITTNVSNGRISEADAMQLGRLALRTR